MPFRSHALPHVTLVAPCGVFVIFRDAERFVFRARTDPKDATPCRPFGREFSCFSPEGTVGRDDKPPFQRRKSRFSQAMKNQG